jgi:hypothetical protein
MIVLLRPSPIGEAGREGGRERRRAGGRGDEEQRMWVMVQDAAGKGGKREGGKEGGREGGRGGI